MKTHRFHILFLLAILTFATLILVGKGCGGGGGGGGGVSLATGTISGTVTMSSAVAQSPSLTSSVSTYADVSGTVPVAGAVCTVEGTDKSATTDQNGFFTIADVSSGSHILICKKTLTSGNVYAFLKIVEVLANQSVDIGTIEITMTGSIQGRATLVNQTDHSGTKVFIPGTSYQATTDATGAYLMTNVPQGTYDLYFEKTGYATAKLTGISATSGKTTVVGDIGLSLSTGATGSLLIENGNTYAASRTVNIAITASTDATLMMITEDPNFVGASWQTVASTTTYNFGSDGIKRLYIKFADANGLESAPTSDEIIVDTTPPTGASISINNGASTTNSLAVTLTLSAADASTSVSQMMISNDPSFTGASWEAYNNTRLWSLTSGDGSKTVYAKFRDIVGNETAQAASASINLNTAGPVISNVVVSAMGTSAIITWDTTETSTGKVDYGIDTNYGSSVTDPNFGTSHTVTLTGLTELTTYHYRISATDSGNNTATTTDFTFRTGKEISGNITSDTTLTAAGGPYVITGNVGIPAGVTLTIEPGARIEYAGAYYILVKGAVIANGTGTQPIVFTAISGLTNSGATQLRFADTNLANSQFNYLIMERASTAIFTDTGNTNTLVVSNLQLANNTINQGGNSYTSPRGVGNISLSNATISNAAINVANSAFNMQDSTIIDSTINLSYASTGASININWSTFTRSTVYSNRDCWSTALKIYDSTFTDSKIQLGASGVAYEIFRDTLTNSYIEGYTNANITISDTTITFKNGFGINCNTSDYAATCTIQYSRIAGNGSGIGINLTNGSISYTEVRDTASAVKIGTNNFVAATGATISNSNLINNASYNLENRTALTITAINNYWGTTDTTTINSLIYDGLDDINYGIVNYTPILNAPQAGTGPR